MTFYTYLFSPETFQNWTQHRKPIVGVRPSQQNLAERVKVGDILLCYLTKIGRFVGVYEIQSQCYHSSEPLFASEDDPFTVRFDVKELAFPELGFTVPVREDRLWNFLSFTKGLDKASSTWTGTIRRSLTAISDADGQHILSVLQVQTGPEATEYPLDESMLRRYFSSRVKTPTGTVSVTIPDDETIHDPISTPAPARESALIQAQLAELGELMGYTIWLPRPDRSSVLSHWSPREGKLLEQLPMNHDESTMRTIELIDVIWVKHRSIQRAFEVEHTTAIYSGLLRIADLLSLQPNLSIKAHIVAPSERSDKVLQELHRPVFALLGGGPLSESVSLLTYDSVEQLRQMKHLNHMTDSVIEEYEVRE